MFRVIGFVLMAIIWSGQLLALNRDQIRELGWTDPDWALSQNFRLRSISMERARSIFNHLEKDWNIPRHYILKRPILINHMEPALRRFIDGAALEDLVVLRELSIHKRVAIIMTIRAFDFDQEPLIQKSIRQMFKFFGDDECRSWLSIIPGSREYDDNHHYVEQ